MLTTVWLAQSAGVFDAVPTSVLNGVGVVGLVLIFFWLLATGRLVTRREVDQIEHDRDEWRTAHRISEQARLEEREHNAALVHDIAEPVKGFLEGFRKATRSEVGEP